MLHWRKTRKGRDPAALRGLLVAIVSRAGSPFEAVVPFAWAGLRSGLMAKSTSNRRRRDSRGGEGGRASPDLHGILVVDKPAGLSSMDVVRRVRRAAGGAKTGHAGTLDPLATGVLVCCIGRATKAVERLMAGEKVYEARIALGAATETDDAEGERVAVGSAGPPSEEAVRAALRAQTGTIEQVPPRHSAVKVGGRRAYARARAGEDVTPEPREAHVHAIELLRYAYPSLDVRITCGKGTYIRSIARDVGRALGTEGYLAALRRTAVGDHTVDRAVALDALPERIASGDLLTPPSG